jgi:hypothetical protein
MMIKFGRYQISQHTYKQWREEEDWEDHETNKKKNMKIMYCCKIKRWTSQGWRGMKLEDHTTKKKENMRNM